MKQAQDARQFQKQAFQLYSLKSIVEKQKAVAVEQVQTEGKSKKILEKAESASNMSIPPGCDLPISKRQAFQNLWKGTLEFLTRLLDLVTEQEKKYEYRLEYQSNFYQRHLMVKHFLASQKRAKSGQHRENLAQAVANTFD